MNFCGLSVKHPIRMQKKEARDFIKDVYQFIDQCGGVSDEQREVF